MPFTGKTPNTQRPPRGPDISKKSSGRRRANSVVGKMGSKWVGLRRCRKFPTVEFPQRWWPKRPERAEICPLLVKHQTHGGHLVEQRSRKSRRVGAEPIASLERWGRNGSGYVGAESFLRLNFRKGSGQRGQKSPKHALYWENTKHTAATSWSKDLEKVVGSAPSQ